MKTIYLDSEYKCYTTAADDRTAVETDFFDSKCDTFIEGYRLVPAGHTWTREDGKVFPGEMVAPWADYLFLAIAQAQYMADQADLAAAYQEGVNSV